MLTIRAKAICIYSFAIVCFISASYPLSAQQARDYFFPANGKNALVVNAHHQGKSHHSKTIFYATTKGDSALMMTQYFDENGATGGQEQTLQISDSEIKVVHTKANTSPGMVEAADGDYVIFKMPGEKAKICVDQSQSKGNHDYRL
ncbi:MAG: hypothetical protein JSS79_18600 [Bacteroidetes bacterium]|nr:hypothetical protein [Bacteroidota bacterium]